VSKKQVRISNPEEIRRRLPEFLQRKISLVLSDSTVIFGTLLNVKKDSVAIANMRLREITLPIARISELFMDLDA
jgi:hypothetical protein